MRRLTALVSVRALALGLLLAMLVVLAACGGGDDEPPADQLPEQPDPLVTVDRPACEVNKDLCQ